MILHGEQIIIKRYDSTADEYVAIGACKSCDINVAVDAIETSSPSSATAKTYKAYRSGWTIKMDHLVMEATAVLETGSTYSIGVMVTENGQTTRSLYGLAICQQADIQATRGQLAKGTFSFLGTGALSSDDTPTPPEPDVPGGTVTIDGDLVVNGDSLLIGGSEAATQQWVLAQIGGGGGGIDMSVVWDALAAGTSQQINASHLSDVLSGYASQSWVETQLSEYMPLTMADNFFKRSVITVGTSSSHQSYNANSYISAETIYISSGDVGGTSYTDDWLNFATSTPPSGGFSLINIKEGFYNRQIMGVYSDAHLYTRIQAYNEGIAWHDWNTIALTTDNVASATKLETSRTIWGQSFNGTANISGALSGATTITASGNVTGANFLTANQDNAYVQIGDIRIVYDLGNNALKIVQSDGETAANLYATGGVSALGQGTSGGGGGVDMDAVWSALAGGSTEQINASHLSDALSDYALASAIPTNNNQLTNGAGYITASALNGYALTSQIPTNNSQLTNGAGYITSSALSNYLPLSGGTMSSTNVVVNLNADLLDGYHADGFFKRIVIAVGTSSSRKSYNANDYTNAETIYKSSGDVGGTACTDEWLNFATSTPPSGGFSLINIKEGFYNRQIMGVYNDAHLYVRPQMYNGGIIWRDWNTIALTTDNVASATKLETSRTIWGQSFNGTANVSGALSGATTITASGNVTGANFLTANQNNAFVQIGNIRIFYDSANNALKIVQSDGVTAANLYATGGISALGVGSSGGGGSIDMSTVWSALASSTTEQINITHLTDALSSYALASQIPTDNSQLTNGAGYITASALNGYALASQIPTNNNQLTNGAGYITASALSGYALTSQIPTNNNQLTNGAGYITSSGNAATATALQTARTIWGQSFDGSANVTGSLSDVTNIDSLLYFDTTNSRVGIGTSSPSYKLDVSGALHASGDVTLGSHLFMGSGVEEIEIYVDSEGLNISPYETGGSALYVSGDAYFSYDINCDNRIWASVGISSDGYVSALGQNTSSDIRMKDVIDYAAILSIDSIANAPAVHYEWKDKKELGMQVGSIAQYWQQYLPEAVVSNEDGMLSMQYGVIALLASISTAKTVQDHERRIAELERENKELKMQLKTT